MEQSREDILKMAQILDDSETVLFEHIKENEAQHSEINDRIDEVTRETTDAFEVVDKRIEEVIQAVEDIELLEPEKGEKGDKGESGKDGINGKDGKDGRDGKDGKDGKDGEDGVNGINGIDGKKGEKGDKPNHEWKGTKLRFEKPNGKWGKYVDLLGKSGTAYTFWGNGGGGNVDLSGYVPYTGATSDVDLGLHNITAANLNISNWNTAYGWGDHASAGYAKLDGSNLPFTNYEFSFGDGSGGQQLRFLGDFTGTMTWNPTATRIISLPDATGTIALTSNLSSYLPLTGGTLSNNLTIYGYLGGTIGSAVSALPKHLRIGGNAYNTIGDTDYAVGVWVGDYNNDAGASYYPYYAEDENNYISFYVRQNGTEKSTLIGGKLYLSGDTATYTDTYLYRSTTNTIYTASILRADGGIAFGGAPTSSYLNYFSKTTSSSVLTPSLFYESHTITGGNTGYANVRNINVTLNSPTVSSSGMAALFGFNTLTAGSLTGSNSGLAFIVRDARTNSETSTTGAGIIGTFQINSACNATYTNATYGNLAYYTDLSTTGTPTVPWAVVYGMSDAVGNLTVTHFKAGMWLNFNQTYSANIPEHYGIRIENVKQGVLNYGISLEGTGTGNGIYFNARLVNLYSSVLVLKTDNNFYAVGDIRTDGVFNINGTDGITEVLTFGGGGSGDVASITVVGGIITARTLVP